MKPVTITDKQLKDLYDICYNVLYSAGIREHMLINDYFTIKTIFGIVSRESVEKYIEEGLWSNFDTISGIVKIGFEQFDKRASEQ